MVAKPKSPGRRATNLSNIIRSAVRQKSTKMLKQRRSFLHRMKAIHHHKRMQKLAEAERQVAGGAPIVDEFTPETSRDNPVPTSNLVESKLPDGADGRPVGGDSGVVGVQDKNNQA
jgi:hypothetical protein